MQPRVLSGKSTRAVRVRMVLIKAFAGIADLGDFAKLRVGARRDESRSR